VPKKTCRITFQIFFINPPGSTTAARCHTAQGQGCCRRPGRDQASAALACLIAPVTANRLCWPRAPTRCHAHSHGHRHGLEVFAAANNITPSSTACALACLIGQRAPSCLPSHLVIVALAASVGKSGENEQRDRAQVPRLPISHCCCQH
jgi:hypothetical protein